MSVVVYGIRSCDRVRAARRWLARHGIDHRLHDVRADGLDPGRLADWARALGAPALLTRRSAAWRALAKRPENPSDEEILQLIFEHPTLLHRPLLETPKGLLLGFDAAEYIRTLRG